MRSLHFLVVLLSLFQLLQAKSLVFTLLGKVSDAAGVAPLTNGASINITVTAAPSINGFINSGGKNIWGFMKSSSNKGIPFKSVEITIGDSMKYAFDFTKATADMWEALLFSVDVSSKTIEFEANVSSTSAGITIGSYTLVGMGFMATLPTIPSCSACSLEDVLTNLIGETSSLTMPEAMVTLYAGGQYMDIVISITSIVVEEMSGGVKQEKPEKYETQASFSNALKLVGIVFGKWEPLTFNISFTGVLVFGSYTFAFYNALDGELGEISAAVGKCKVKSWGSGVTKGVLAILGLSDLASATGLSYDLPAGLTAQAFIIISRFDVGNVQVTGSPMELDFQGTVKISVFYRFRSNDRKGKNILKEGGAMGTCAPVANLCIGIKIIGTSTVGAYTGTENSGALSISSPMMMWGLLPLLFPAFFLH